MALQAGSVYVYLGGKLDQTAFKRYEAAANSAAAKTEAAEKRMIASTANVNRSLHTVGTAAKIGAGAGILVLGKIMYDGVKQAASLEQTLNVLQQTSGATGKQMRAVAAEARKLGADVKLPGTSAKDAAEAMLELSKGGLSVTQTMKAARGVLQLAAAAQLSNADAATIVADSLNAFGLKGRDAVKVADLLAASANATTASMPEMADALKQVGASAHQLGIPIEDVVTGLGELANAGIKGSDAGTSFKTMLSALTPNSKQAADAIDKLGVHTFDAHGKFVGMRDVIAQYREGLSKLTDQQKAQALETIFGSDASRAANIILDQGVGAFDRLKKKSTETGAAGDLAAAQMKGLQGAVEGLKSAAETAETTLGQALLPVLTDGAKQVGDFISSLDPEQLRQFGEQVASGLGEAGNVLGDFARAGGDVAGVLMDIGNALNLGDVSKIEAIVAGFVGFQAAGVAAPLVGALANSIQELVLNARTAPTLLAFLKDLPIGPLGAVTGAAALLAAGLVLLGTQESEESKIARDSAKAHQDQAAAMKAVQDAELAAADKGLAAKQAQLDYKKAVENFNEVRKKSKKGSDEWKQAELAVQQTYLRSTAASDAYKKSVDAQNDAVDKAVSKSRDALKKAQDEVDRLQSRVTPGPPAAGGIGSRIGAQTGAPNKEDIRALAEAQRALADANEGYIASLARSAISETNRQRLMKQSKAITAENTQGVASLIKNLEGVPTERQTKLLLEDQGALAEAGDLARRLDALGEHATVVKVLTTAPSAQAAVAGLQAALVSVPASTLTKINTTAPSAGAAVAAFHAILKGVPASKAVKILQNADSAKSAVDRLRAAIDALHDKQVTLTTLERTIRTDRAKGGQFASGRGPGQASRGALVGEGAGPEWVVDPEGGIARKVMGPAFMNLGPDDYVIPTEPKHRSAAIGLMKALARDLGIDAFGGGKAGKPKATAASKKPKRILPAPPKDWRVGNPDELKDDIDKLDKIADEKVAKGKLKGHLTARAQEARAELRRYRPVYAKSKRLADAIDANKERADNAYAALQLADKKNDQKGFDRNLGTYKKTLDTEQGELQGIYDALRSVGKEDTAYGRLVRSKLLDVQSSAQDALSLAMTPPEVPELTPAQQAAQDAADREADTGMTDAERAALATIDKNVALAALTPDLGDDTAAAQSKVDFLKSILGAALVDPARGGDTSIADLAGQLKQATDNLSSLAGGTSSNENADLQAQIDQSNERTRVATANQAISDAALKAFQGFSAGGPGGLAPVVNVYQQNLVPGSSDVLRRVGDAAAAGFDVQGFRRPVRVRVGL